MEAARAAMQLYMEAAKGLLLEVEAQFPQTAWKIETVLTAQSVIRIKQQEVEHLVGRGLLKPEDAHVMEELLQFRQEELALFAPQSVAERQYQPSKSYGDDRELTEDSQSGSEHSHEHRSIVVSVHDSKVIVGGASDSSESLL